MKRKTNQNLEFKDEIYKFENLEIINTRKLKIES